MKAQPFKTWVRALANPVMPGMDDDSPRARPLAVALMLAFIATQVVLRYRYGFLSGKAWQAAHVVIGVGGCLGIFVAFHGLAPLRRVRRQTWALLGFGVLMFLVFWYVGRMDSWRRWFQPLVASDGAYSPIYGFMYFATCAMVFRLFMPVLFARAAFGIRPADLGLFAPRNAHPPAVRRIWPVYLLLFLGVLPFVIGVAETTAFQHKYPMCRAMITPEGTITLEHLLVYEAFYALIFISGESLWRGILTFSAERDLGLYALVLMVVPYVTAHFGKPLPETLGAIAAGMTLGWLALKHRSVWLGVALHYAVAVSMDLLAIRANGFLVLTG